MWQSVCEWVCVRVWVDKFDLLSTFWCATHTLLNKSNNSVTQAHTHTLAHTHSDSHSYTYSPREWQFDFGIKLTVRSINKLNLFAGKTFLLKFMSLPHVVAMQTPILPLSHSYPRALQSSTHNKWNMFLRQLASGKGNIFYKLSSGITFSRAENSLWKLHLASE